MRISHSYQLNSKTWVIALLLGLSLNCVQNPVKAFVPYIYEPSLEDLKTGKRKKNDFSL